MAILGPNDLEMNATAAIPRASSPLVTCRGRVWFRTMGMGDLLWVKTRFVSKSPRHLRSRGGGFRGFGRLRGAADAPLHQ